VWAQIKQHVNVGGAEVLRDDNLLRWFLDPDVVIPNPRGVTVNLEPLMINISSSLQLRPEASTEIPNLFLASDYVKTNTDVACMEAANEAARRAVNALLDQEESTAARVAVWSLKVPEILQPFIDYDRLRFLLGLGHGGSKQTWWGKTLGRLYGALT
jgi:15-cis-phytoene desaturase